jgi:2-polyprenyl-6-methoxyphenol hydroxylase-like FAD-dependent oxidoreductase
VGEVTIASAPGPTGDVREDSYEVLVVGGGPVGLGSAIELGRRGVKVLLVDGGDGVVRYPTAESVDVASMELLQRWGIADAVDDSGFAADMPRDIAFVTGMTGYELARFPRPSNAHRGETSQGRSAQGGVWWPKFWFDAALRARALAEPTVELRYGWTCDQVVDGGLDAGATVTLVSPDLGRRTIRAQYVLACDGAGSPIRRSLGVRQLREHEDVRARWQGAYVRLPALRERSPHAPAVQYYLINPRRMILGSLDGADLWRITYPLGADEHPDIEQVTATIIEALDSDADHVEVLDAREWSGDAAMAETFRSGRILLAGDSAHRMWPSGGHGMNTGLGDVSNVGWKLAGVVQGWAPPELLDTYTVERSPHAERMVRRSWENYRADLAVVPDPRLDDRDADAERSAVADQIVTTRQREWQSLDIQLGTTYVNSPIVVPDPTAAPDERPGEWMPTARPGRRAPYVAPTEEDTVADIRTAGFVVQRVGSSADVTPLTRALQRRGVPVDEAVITSPAARASYPHGIALIRPDGVLAWHGDTLPPDLDGLVDQVTGVCLQ